MDCGDLTVESEDFELDETDPARSDNLHVHMLCRVTGPQGEAEMGVFE